MNKTIMVEAKLLLREPGATIFAVLLPLGLLLGLGSTSGLRETLPGTSGERVIDIHFPTMMVLLAVVTMALTVLPATLVTYRENGVLRRLSTTPVRPVRLLVAQVVNNLAMAVVATVLLIASGWLVLGSALPKNVLAFTGVFVLGTASMFGLGLLIAAVAPNAKTAPALGSLLMFPLLYVSGMWTPGRRCPSSSSGSATSCRWPLRRRAPRDLGGPRAAAAAPGGHGGHRADHRGSGRAAVPLGVTRPASAGARPRGLAEIALRRPSGASGGSRQGERPEGRRSSSGRSPRSSKIPRDLLNPLRRPFRTACRR
ncbi:ABC transporter permease [Streptosporangium lutulentum]